MKIKELLSKKIKIDGVDEQTIQSLLSVPPKSQMGDFALPCFGFAKIQRCAPNQIAQNLAASLQNDDLIDHCEVLNGYLNIYLNKQNVLCSIVDELSKTKNLTQNNTGKGKKVCIDFSSVNIAKEPHIGHFFSTVIGASIARLYEASGFDVVRMNYLGDYGSQFAKLVRAYQVWGDKQQIIQGGINALQKLYIKANEVCKEDPKFLDECRQTFRKMEDKILLTTNDILEKEFKIDARGYRPQEVDKFLDIIIKDYTEYERLLGRYEKELKELMDENSKLKADIRSLKSTLSVAENNKGVTNVDILRRLSELEKIWRRINILGKRCI